MSIFLYPSNVYKEFKIIIHYENVEKCATIAYNGKSKWAYRMHWHAKIAYTSIKQVQIQVKQAEPRVQVG